MPANHLTCVTVLGTLLIAADQASAELKVQEDKENVVGSRLVGSWEPDEDLTRRLGGRATTVAFSSDPSIAPKIPAKYEGFLKDKPIYLAGTMKAGSEKTETKDYPFILIENKGNPYLVYFRERGGDAYGDAESMNVMLAVGKETSSDLLFLGGDFNNQPFGAHHRVPAKP